MTDDGTAPLRPVTCGRCGVRVQVAKNSLAHTLVQWTTDSDRCAGLTERSRPGVPRALTPTCPDLRAGIEAAVRAGNLDVPGV